MKSGVSIVIPSGYKDSRRQENLRSLIDDIRHQTVLADEVVIVRGVWPRTRAHNEGAEAASGKFIVFFDDDVRLGNDQILEKLIEPLRHGNIGITGAAVLPTKDSTPFQKRCHRELLRAKNTIAHAALAIPKDLYWKTGGEDGSLRINDDAILNYRVREMGYSAEFVPEVFVYHPDPGDFSELVKKSFRQGIDQAHAYKRRPDIIFRTPLRQGGSLEKSSVLKQILRNIKIIISSIFRLKFLLFAARISTGIGFAFGYLGMDNKVPTGKGEVEKLLL
jgi:glycosyltransferase involved in cell wall biosynthesis